MLLPIRTELGELAKNPKIYHGKVKQAQDIIQKSYTVSAIEDEWVKVVKEFFVKSKLEARVRICLGGRSVL